jgi:hypothetical protein
MPPSQKPVQDENVSIRCSPALSAPLRTFRNATRSGTFQLKFRGAPIEGVGASEEHRLTHFVCRKAWGLRA